MKPECWNFGTFGYHRTISKLYSIEYLPRPVYVSDVALHMYPALYYTTIYALQYLSLRGTGD